MSFLVDRQHLYCVGIREGQLVQAPSDSQTSRHGLVKGQQMIYKRRTLHDGREQALQWRKQLCNGPSYTMQPPSESWNQQEASGKGQQRRSTSRAAYASLTGTC
jgi:hypothetical protein